MAQVVITIEDTGSFGKMSIATDFNPVTPDRVEDFTPAQNLGVEIMQAIGRLDPKGAAETFVKDGVLMKDILAAEKQQKAGKAAN